jgi:hypothetical protein
MNVRTTFLLFAVLVMASGRLARAEGPDSALADQGFALLKTYCFRCHGQKFEVPGYDVTKREVLVAPSDEDKPYVTPGKPELSLIWERVGVLKNMPPKKETKRPNAAEVDLLKRWIEAGLPFPKYDVVARPFKSIKDVLTSIRDDLRKTDRDDRPYRRYFTLTNLWNDKTVSDSDLRIARAALSKVVNSLSWEREIVVPRAVAGTDETVYVLDLRDLGWDRTGLWQTIAASNRYGLVFDSVGSRETRDVAEEVYRFAESKKPFVRGDWFIATASRSPLYEAILDLPSDAAALQKLLKVDVPANYQRLKLARAGFSRSGVSSQNRVVERHAAANGAYWQSFDFKLNNPKQNIFRLPLGPDSDDNPFGAEGFRPDGGEILFNLPNGLQGYMLVNGQGKRINEAPAEVVHDPTMVAGSTIIVNGLSCMSCHKQGMMDDLNDEVRAGHGLEGRLAEQIEAIYVERGAMKALLRKDKERFLKALAEATGPFLKEGESGSGADEPITFVASTKYLREVSPITAALELGLEDPAQLQGAIRANDDLRRLGLGPLADGNAIKREEWEAKDRSNSLFQEAALALRLGTPIQ